MKSFNRLSASVLTAVVLFGPASNVMTVGAQKVNPKTAQTQNGKLNASQWAKWIDVKSDFAANDATGKQVKHGGKIWQATWWVGTTEPGSSEAYNTGWKNVGTVSADGTVTLNSGITANPFEPSGATSNGNSTTPYANIDAGQGKKWENHVFSPYIDSGLWYSSKSGGGLFPLGEIATSQAKTKYANLGFVIADPFALKEGKVVPTFAGAYNLDGTGAQASTVSAFSKQVKNYRAQGGDVMVSFGGENGTPLHVAYDNAEALADKYIEIIKAWGLTAIDFDIEGSYVRDTTSWRRNNEALKIVQEKLGDETPDFWFTFPVLPTGLVNSKDGQGNDSDAYNIIKEAVAGGIDVKGVNIMTMCFGPSFVTGATNEYYKYVIAASESLKQQLTDIYAAAGTPLSEKAAYQKIGLTPWIGKSTQPNETFVQSDAKKLVAYALDKKIGMLSFWSLNRDNAISEDLKNTGIDQKPFEFSSIFSKIENLNDAQKKPENEKPTFSGVTDKTIKVGDTFDQLAGVKAKDKEDGDLTKKIVVLGTVDTKKPGKYILTYIVKDSDKQETAKKRTITVKSNEEMPNEKPVFSGVTDKTIKVGDKFDNLSGVKATDKEDGDLTTQIKVEGAVDTTKAGKYTLTYSVKDTKGQETKKTRSITVTETSFPEWSATTIYHGGEIVTYNGKTYQAKWWTQGNRPDLGGLYGPWAALDGSVIPNEKPIISGATDQTIKVGDKFNHLSGVKATDKEDGDLTAKLKVTGTVDTSQAGKYILTYSVKDSKQQETKVTRTITVKDNEEVMDEKPVISGATDKTIKIGDKFDRLSGVKASDKEDGDLTAKLKVTGTVDTSQAGKYVLTYSVKDSKGQETTITRNVTVKAASTGDYADEMVNPVKDVMVGYWHNWASKSDGYQQGTALSMRLDEINKDYNVIDVSFMKADAGSHIPTFKPYGVTDEAFRAQVSDLNKAGRSVLLALGGADAHIELTRADEAAFVAEIINQVDKYGFDGIDLDLEQSAITAADNQTVIPSALKKVKDHYAKEGKNFLITMAPEFPYLKANGAYIPYIQNLEGYYDWINPQYYNQGGDGISGENGQWLAQNNDNKKEEFLYHLTKALVTGTDGYSSYVKIPADKFVIGLPSNNDAAATGYVKDPKAVEGAMKHLEADGLRIKGLMTWSVNWDGGQDKTGKKYAWEFVNRYSEMLELEVPEDKTPGNAKPVLTGIEDATVFVGSQFDPMKNVKASDKEDGDLTAKIKVSGKVDTSRAGRYTLTYSVKDTAGKETKATRLITVKANEESSNAKPVISGATDQSIKVGESFDPLKGVTARDKEDGDLTSKLQVTGTVDKSKVGKYTLTYTVKDSKGLEAKLTRTITVTDTFNPEWSASFTYTGGELVAYKGKTYQAKWWTKGDQPDQVGVYGPWGEVK